MGKYYAVKAGRTPGIYLSWEDCKAQVSGFKGALYKSFDNMNDAAAFIDSGINISPEPMSDKFNITAYVDGSYDDATHAFSYGMVIFHAGRELHFAEKYEDSELASMHNVAGEIKGAEAAMRYGIENDCTGITIYHDYEGIAKWCLGEWKANKNATIAYREYYNSIKDRIKINFVKVKGHSGDKYNELADKLAKSALGLE